jgi:hypothetical protein
MLVVSVCGGMQAAQVDANTGLNAVEAAAAGVTAHRLNSMMEAYMSGRFAASTTEGLLKYDNHDASADDQKDDCAYEDTVGKINAELKSIYSEMSWNIDGWRPLDFHLVLERTINKDDKVALLKNFTEKDKINVQALRLYDFLKVINMDLPEDVTQQLKNIADDIQLSDENKGESIQKILDEQNEKAETIRANRKALAKAFTAGNAAQVLEACKKPLHAAPFVSLNSAIQKMITDIQAGEENALCSNHTRAQAQGCIIS